MPETALAASIAEAAARLRARQTSCVELAQAFLARIPELQPKLNAFITVTAEHALAVARERDVELKSGRDRGLLHGIPIAHKDCFDTAGILTTVGAEIFRHRVPQSDAAVVERLAAAGAVMLGKTHMNEFAAGMSGRNAFFGDAHNPRDASRAAGGSSSGSACAVAARMCLGASGSDAGGSIRLPAAWTGIVGLRPTHGAVSTAGVFPRSFSFDCVGPLARSVADTIVLFEAMVGYKIEPQPRDLRGVRLGVIGDVNSDVFVQLGAETREIDLPPFEPRIFFDILLYEFHQILGKEPDRRFGPVVRANLERGAKISTEEYRAALAERNNFAVSMNQIFVKLDALITPTAPMAALALDAPEPDFDRAREFTLPFSLAGLPAISVPCGLDRGGLPLGMQIVGERGGDSMVLRIAAAYESAMR